MRLTNISLLRSCKMYFKIFDISGVICILSKKLPVFRPFYTFAMHRIEAHIQLELIVLRDEFALFTLIWENFWYKIYPNRRQIILCSRLSLITLTFSFLSLDTILRLELDGFLLVLLTNKLLNMRLFEARNSHFFSFIFWKLSLLG